MRIHRISLLGYPIHNALYVDRATFAHIGKVRIIVPANIPTIPYISVLHTRVPRFAHGTTPCPQQFLAFHHGTLKSTPPRTMFHEHGRRHAACSKHFLFEFRCGYTQYVGHIGNKLLILSDTQILKAFPQKCGYSLRFCNDFCSHIGCVSESDDKTFQIFPPRAARLSTESLSQD